MIFPVLDEVLRVLLSSISAWEYNPSAGRGAPSLFKDMIDSFFDPSDKKQAKASPDAKGSLQIPSN